MNQFNEPDATVFRCEVGYQGCTGDGSYGSDFITTDCKTKKMCFDVLRMQGFKKINYVDLVNDKEALNRETRRFMKEVTILISTVIGVILILKLGGLM